jgi:1-acyl-sn-glycerol-3-phosphate acyltransferase
MIKAMKKINNEVVRYGSVATIRKLLKKFNTNLIVNTTKTIDDVLKNGSGIIVANHPAEADVLAILASIKQRNDFYLIINSNLTKIIPELDKNLIPVYINNKLSLFFDGRFKTWVLSLFHKFEQFSKEKEKEKNIESIKLAIKKINQGGLVIIFPDGGNKKKDWFNGIGYLIHGIKNKKNKFIIRTRIEGTSNWDYLRLIPFLGKLLPKFRVSFCQPLKMSLVKKDNPKTTTNQLENKYWTWLGSLHLWKNLSKNYAWMRVLFLFLMTKPC